MVYGLEGGDRATPLVTLESGKPVTSMRAAWGVGLAGTGAGKGGEAGEGRGRLRQKRRKEDDKKDVGKTRENNTASHR